MHIENFKIFSDLVESESFSRAAKLNGITQSAVSQQLRAMEKHFNILIVDRSQKQFRLTREGKKLFESAKEILYLYDKLNSELQEMKKVISGTIHISTVYSIGLHELPPYVKVFLAKFPEVNIRVEYRRANMVYEDILTNSIDLGLIAYPQKHKQLEVLPFHDDVLVLVVSPEHPFAKLKSVDIQEVAGQKFIGFEPDIPTRKATDIIFKEAEIENEPVMEFDNVETVKRAVEINAGIAILPQTTVVREEAQGLLKVLKFKNKTYKRPLALIHRKGRVLTPAIKKLIDLLTSKDLNRLEQVEAEIADLGDDAK
ncbi:MULTISPECIES: LysR family transcriptional regulator [unclassified Lentimonas]|uniref:LysR family transcriptional regulator n=1 Tax=unclassified Lentimonas TaxID=2630993 RepID=UPI00132A92C1|nr:MULTISPECIES: LysR family transcriptional regulator [unclassified Lentimonas]CAA6679254.1 Cys regulon transcriptional activator CysB [Lentimonas sp. CC4]CAA6685919.1 Cys regulon transcriptional activator CysB [Lentimonas sp. CC6]CAA6689629.1 Cys regulon transcriptional activator CysB [Lentimonas sp. CC10]CAA6691906.1 Cys regulon transcriptional activator CysB [Lentimonas sp. CC19]CAA7072163.1 Cys regulon transcriptional activator CysB [Lentimonas sp. CC11]